MCARLQPSLHKPPSPRLTFHLSWSLTHAPTIRKKKRKEKWQMQAFARTWHTHTHDHLVNKTGAVATIGLPIQKQTLPSLQCVCLNSSLTIAYKLCFAILPHTYRTCTSIITWGTGVHSFRGKKKITLRLNSSRRVCVRQDSGSQPYLSDVHPQHPHADSGQFGQNCIWTSLLESFNHSSANHWSHLTITFICFNCWSISVS